VPSPEDLRSLLQRKVSELSAVQLQMLEIAKALRLARGASSSTNTAGRSATARSGCFFDIVRNIAAQARASS
jgi:hypothetical protein